MLSEKDLDQRGKRRKEGRKPYKTGVRKPCGGSSPAFTAPCRLKQGRSLRCYSSRRKIFSLPSNSSANEKPPPPSTPALLQSTFAYNFLSQLPFSLYNNIHLCSPDLPVIHHSLQAPNCNSSAIPK